MLLRSVVLLFEIFFILIFLQSITCKSYYSIVAPGTIRSNRKYTVSATLHNVSHPAVITVGLRYNSILTETQNVSLQPLESKSVDFFPPKLDLSKKYELFVEGVEGLYFKNSTELLVGENEGVNIYIETDRGTYKPSDLLRFRIVILDEHAKPVKINEPIKVQIFDGSGHRVKQFKDITLQQGVFTNEFQLSKEPILGSWSIKAIVGGKYAQEKQAEFTVDKYVLPKFFVTIETQSNVRYNEKSLKINVYGKYTYNKPVEGKVTLRIKQIEEHFLGNTFDLANYAADTVDSKASFELNLNDFPTISRAKRLVVSAALKEKQTGTTEIATTDISLQRKPYNITMLFDQIEFKNGKISLIKVQIQHWNRTAVTDSITPVFIKIKNDTFEQKLDCNGIATLEGEIDHYMLTVIFNNNEKIFYLPNAYDKHFYNCEMKINNKSSKLNSTVDITVNLNGYIPYIVYVVTAHGNIVENGLVHVKGDKKYHTIQLVTRNELVPVSFLYVHFIYNDKLTFCEMKIELPEKFENDLTVVTPRIVKPGENITMTLNTDPGSHVAITAVDLSSMLMNKGNRIQKNEIMRDMRDDNSYASFDKILPGIYSGLVTLTDVPYSAMLSGWVDSPPKRSIRNPQDIRSYFPETWIFLDLNITKEVTEVNFTLPDSITTWVLTGFSVNDKSGIGLLDTEVEILSIKPFFISAYLPYSVKRDEIIAIPIMVSNYYSEGLDAEIVMENPLNEFQFVDNLTNETTSSKLEKRNILMPANSVKSVYFVIKPKKLGQVGIRVQAENKIAGDKIIQKLLVEADGLETSHNSELYISLQEGQNYVTRLIADIPEEIEIDTESVQLSISGDILLPSLVNIENLVNMPKGCGEQNMINLAPNILILEYLSASGQNFESTDLVKKALNFTEMGFQNQLNYLDLNGGFSVFGPKSVGSRYMPSNWLTAYVVRFFIKGMKYLPIENKLIEKSLSYLADTQLSSGEFPNSGYLFHQSYKSSYSLTAFVLLSFLENAKYAKKYKAVIQKAINYLASDINEVDDIYSLALMAFALQTAKHEKASELLDRLQLLASSKKDLQWWHDVSDNGSNDVEITSYILLALVQTPGNYLPIVKWLMEQRNSNGGFKSTQNTVVGLQALIKFAQLSAPQTNSLLRVSYQAFSKENKGIKTGVLTLHAKNLKILQHRQLPPSTRSVHIEISGSGSIFLQFSYNYQLQLDKQSIRALHDYIGEKSFNVRHKAELLENGLILNLELCVQYAPPENVQFSSTNMIITEVGLPSGYIANEKNLAGLKGTEEVERVENETPDKIVLYSTFTEANEEKCIDLVANKKHDVINLKPSKIIVYDYYHSDRREVVTYDIQNNTQIN